MTPSPNFEAFSKVYAANQPQLLWLRISSDTLTPVAALLKLAALSPYHLLFESIEGGKTRARYSIIALDPDMIWTCNHGKVTLNGEVQKYTSVFDSLRALINVSTLDIPASLPPMAAGLFGYMGYGMVRHIETLPDLNKPDPIAIADSMYMRPRATVIFDSVKDEAIIACPVWVSNISAEVAYAETSQYLGKIRDVLQSPFAVPDAKGEVAEFETNMDDAAYMRAVEQAKEYILAGDIFQVVPSRRWKAQFTYPAFSLYRAMRRINPSPYLFYLHMKDFSLIGSSPEILVRLKDDKVTIRPIAGTRPRGKTELEDIALEKELLADGKEVAEHLMLLDLGRNDVGKVAAPGSVKVTERMVIERYSHVMHIVSNVEGTLKPGLDALDALQAGFPAGTVSGAPKIRAMQIIEELEPEARSFYGGTVGYFSAQGEMDTCIALRTALVKDNMLYIQAGAGVVADSNPQAEAQETLMKAHALVKDVLKEF